MRSDQKVDTKERARNITAFFFFGILIKLPLEIISSATADVFAGSSMATSTLSVIGGLTGVIFRLFLSWVLPKLSYSTKIVIITFLHAAGFIVIVISDSVVARLVGVCVMVLGNATAEMTLFSLTAFYSRLAIHAFGAGTGVGSVLASLYYTGVTSWTCVSPSVTVATAIPSFSLFFIVYWAILDKSPLEQNSQTTFSFSSAKYETLLDYPWNNQYKTELSLKQRLFITWKIYWVNTFLFWQYFADNLSMKAIVTTFAFPQASFYPRDHFTYYALSRNIGKFLTRCYLLVFSTTCSSVVRHVQVGKTWIFSIFGMAMMFFSALATWYRFLSNVEVILGLCFAMGACTGCIFLNSPLVVAENFEDDIEREFAQGMLTVGSTAGDCAAGLMGLFVEPYFKHHCLFELNLGDYCLTRFPTITGWVKNVHCSKKQ